MGMHEDVREYTSPKRCTKCGETKPAAAFRRDGNTTDGRQPWCKSCRNTSARAQYAQCPEKQREYDRKWRVKRPDVDRWRNLKRKYKITRRGWNDMLVAQGGVCAGCGKPPSGRGLEVDHDHSCCPAPPTCGRCTRGLLCTSCNVLDVLA